MPEAEIVGWDDGNPMDPKQLKKCEARLYSRVWLLGGWLRRRAARELAEALARHDVDAAMLLSVAVARGEDPAVRIIALEALSQLRERKCIDAVCAVWAMTRHPDLAAMLATHHWVAAEPPEVRVLTVLKEGRLESFTHIGAKVARVLLRARQDSDPEIAQRAAQVLGQIREPAAVDAVCTEWAETRAEDLADLLGQRRWVAAHPPEVRVLTALKARRSEVVVGGGAEVAAPLVAALQDRDEAIGHQARLALGRLKNAGAIDGVCGAWAASRSDFLAGLIAQHRWMATAPPPVRLLSALKAGSLEVAARAEPELLEPLLEACEDRDEEIRQRARQALGQLKNPQTRERLCLLLLEQEHPVAREAVVAGRYAPRDEHQRALLFFLTEQWSRYEELDFDGRLLRSVYGSAGAPLRQRLVERLRAAGRTDFLTVIVGADYRSRAGAMTDGETQFLVQMLATNREWDRLWALVVELPFAAGVQVVRILAQNGWRPEADDERAALERLASLAAGDMAAAPEELSRYLPPAVRRAKVRVAGRVNDVAFSPVRPIIAVGTGQRRLVTWNFQAGTQEQLLESFGHSIGRVNYTGNGTLVCAERTNSDDACGIYGWSDGQRFRLGRHKGSVTALEPVGDGNLLTAGRDGLVTLWEAGAARRLKETRFGDSWPRGASVSPDGTQAALLHQGVSLVALPSLDLMGGTSDQFWQGVSRCAAFAPDGKALVVGKFNGEVLVCERRGTRLTVAAEPLYRHSGLVRGVAALPKRSVIVTVGHEGRIQFTSWPSRASVGTVQMEGEQLSSVRVSPDGSFMAVGHADVYMSLWDLRVADVPALFGRPLARAVPMDLAAVGAVCGDATLEPRARRALQFMECVLRHRFRYDIEIDEVATIRMGEFDIEIE